MIMVQVNATQDVSPPEKTLLRDLQDAEEEFSRTYGVIC